MDDNRTWQEQLDAFMQSELGSSVIRPGMETAFTGDFDDWLRSLNLDQWEGDVGFGEYLEDRLERFLEHQLDAGHLDPPHLGEVGFEPMLWDALYDIAMAGLEGRYRDEVARGVREDMRDNAIVHLTFRDGQVLDLDAEAQRDSFLGEGDEEIVSEERFTGVRWERVGQGDAETVQFTGVNASGQRQVIGGPDEGRHVAQDREGVLVLADAPRSMTERVQDLCAGDCGLRARPGDTRAQ